MKDARLWHVIWSLLLVSPSSPRLIELCKNVLCNSEGLRSSGGRRMDNLLRYLFKYAPECQESLVKRCLQSDDLPLRWVAAEEFSKTNRQSAMIAMLDI